MIEPPLALVDPDLRRLYEFGKSDGVRVDMVLVAMKYFT